MKFPLQLINFNKYYSKEFASPYECLIFFAKKLTSQAAGILKDGE
jgi:hypothetical protein